jgi:F-type H+-transporting ATPase subunit epsilon
MAKAIPFSLITPKGIAFEGEASLVIAAGTEGEIGIMASHAPYLTALKPGVVRANVVEDGAERRLVLATSAGFLQALPGRIRIVVDLALTPEAIEVDAVEAELEAAKTRQAAISHDANAYAHEQEIIDFANAKLAARSL